jgi:selenocysteine lyase/cysteine desulfurase
VAQETIEFQNDARKFEAGTHNLLGLNGLIAAMQLTLEIGVDSIASELARKRAWLVAALKTKPFEILNPKPEPENVSGITTIFQPGKNLTPVHLKLTEAGIATSLRADRKGQQYIRFSPHFYNTDEELQRALDLL